jgi:glycosyltransferase 2 family protein
MKKIILGIIVSIVFVYFSLREVEFDKVLIAFKNSRYLFLIPAMALSLLASFLRSLRWGVILSPIVRISQRKLFPILCVGQMGAALIPMRIGEFVRPYLVNVESKIPLSSALATILVERLFDAFAVLSIFLFITFNSTLPDWLVTTGYVLIIALAVMSVFVLLINFKPKFAFKISSLLFKIFPQKLQWKLENMISKFADGFKIISSPIRLVYILLLSFAAWGCFGLGIYVLFSSSNLQLTLIDALIVLVCTIMGISIPAAPCNVGNFHFATIVALSLFGISKSEALSFSILFHFTAIGKHILLGLIFVPLVKLSFKDVKNRFNQQ